MDAVFFGLSAETRDILSRDLGFVPRADFFRCPTRDLDAVEVFSGMGHLSAALEDVFCPVNGSIFDSWYQHFWFSFVSFCISYVLNVKP